MHAKLSSVPHVGSHLKVMLMCFTFGMGDRWGMIAESNAPRAFLVLNRLSLNGDENEISLYIITTCSNIQVTRIKEMITKDKIP